ncbi:MAG: formate--tetrahydrofolate ligase [Candidatus Omnitrophota bacterium]
MKSITVIARQIGIKESELELYGKYKAKISLSILSRIKKRPLGRYVVVTTMTPTKFGEGKTVTTIGLGSGLSRLGKKSVITLRQPSMGPVFGLKGGGAGGGRSKVEPSEDINLHFTGDMHAVGAANNLLCAFIDNHLARGNRLDIDPEAIMARRTLDVSDRALRRVKTMLGDDGTYRDTGFDITAASEVMAILALASGRRDLRKRIGRIIAAFTRDKRPVFAEDLKCAGAMAAILKDAVKPNLVQTSECVPCIMHAGPFANIAHGNNSVLADMIALRLGDYVITESGFGVDCGAEKLFDIKCRVRGLKPPDGAVLVCTTRALKTHGAGNMRKHIENIKAFGLNLVVAINRFPSDSKKDLDEIKKTAIRAGAEDAVISEARKKGSRGAVQLAKAVIRMCEKKSSFKFLYPLEAPIKQKIDIIAKKIYGAREVRYSGDAEKKITLYEGLGYGGLPVNMAKTHLSLSHDPKITGRPEGFTLPIRDVKIAAGAGFLYPLCGEIRTMPGLPAAPRGEKIDIDKNGKITGLS